MVSIFQAILLSIIQGITEWLPISSTGHLAIAEGIFGLKEFSFAVFLHIASILAVLFIFYKDIIKILDIRKKENLKYIVLIIIAMIPAGIIGFLFKDRIESAFSNLFFIGIFFIISGIIIFSTKFFHEKKENIGFRGSIFIGLFQVLGLLPGISRSGSTISGGIFSSIKKSEVVKFSFILSIPIVLGASLIEAKNIVSYDVSWNILILSFIITFIVSIIAIKMILKVIKGDKFYLFGVYNFILGLIVLIWSLVK